MAPPAFILSQLKQLVQTIKKRLKGAFKERLQIYTFLFLRTKPNKPRPDSMSGKAAGKGTALAGV